MNPKKVTVLFIFGLLVVATACSQHKRMFTDKKGAGVKDAWLNVCTSGKDPNKLTVKEYLTAFAAGPCSPTILLPGIMGSVLRVEINCPVLRSSDPTTFKNCGWSTCPADKDYTVGSSPKTEYQVWVPGVDSPMTIAAPTEPSKLCWGNLVEVLADTSSGTYKPIPKPGVTFSVKGFTPETDTLATSQCGTTGVEDLIDGIIDPDITKYFKAVIQRLIDMGFKSGLTLQAIPYDFRLNSGLDLASKNLPSLLKKMKQITNKKAIIMSHSMGNQKTAFALWNMNQADKDNTVSSYVALAPPFIGAAKPIDYLSCGSAEFFFLKFGIDMTTWKLSAGTFPSMFELAPFPTYSTQASQPWMQQVMGRINYEAGKSTDPVFNFLPDKTQTCYPKFNNKYCKSGLEVFDNYATYLGQPLTNNNIRAWLNQHSFNKFANVTWPTIDPRFETLPNTGVPIILVYTQILDTEGKYNYTADPLTTSNQNKYCTANEHKWTPWRGDTTVPSTAAVTAGLKWAYEFSQGTANAKPIKFVDICSEVNVKTTPYDSTTAQGVNTMSKLEYIGMPCDCTQTKTRHCTHEDMLFLPELIDFLSNTILTKDVQPLSPTVQQMTDAQLTAFQNTCQILKQLVNPTMDDAPHAESQ